MNALTVYDDGTGPALVVAGQFATAGGSPANRIASWDGASWSPLGSGLSHIVRALTVYDNGSQRLLVAGGDFAMAGGAPAAHIAVWDGSSWSPLGTGMDGPVLSLGAFDDSSSNGPALYAGGEYLVAGGLNARGIARWNGSSWRPLGGGLGTVFTTPFSPPPRVAALALFDELSCDNPALYAGGVFLGAGPTASQNVARWFDACAQPGSVATYCVGKTNSLGCVPFVSTVGAPSATATDSFGIRANDVLPGEIGFLLYGFKAGNLGFHGGKLCVKAPVTRLLPPQSAKATGAPPCTGLIKRDFNQRIQSGVDPLLTSGQRVYAQWRLRDSADPAGFGDSLTDAVRFEICP